MADASRRERGLAKFDEVYAGDLPAPPPGAMAFFDLMIEQLFAEVWTREALSQRDRRLLTMGVIAALGEHDTFCIQVRAGVKNGEFTPEQVREMIIHLAAYAGYPRAAGLVGRVEKVLAELAGGG
ncbi:MAG: carboxymuconolactone decarboxylase family protein [Proteobacteria bacterium]|nr:carboxymuconolactone decarboxylase family protein [Pseudomonadota bacterium]MCZ6784957.1 carboxymuconolactone decarboxylase family protein [Pseudomonadota bacterium]